LLQFDFSYFLFQRVLNNYLIHREISIILKQYISFSLIIIHNTWIIIILNTLKHCNNMPWMFSNSRVTQRSTLIEYSEFGIWLSTSTKSFKQLFMDNRSILEL
jgi:hypothetical protein